MVPPTGVTSNFSEHENLTSSFASIEGMHRAESSNLDNLNDVLDTLAEWDAHLSKAGIGLDDLEPGL